MIPVLVVTGPAGVGKSAVLHKADQLLVEAQIPHATVVLEEIARFWPARQEPESRERMVLSNLASLWSNFAARGADRLLLERILWRRSQIQHLCGAIPGSKVTVVRLHAPLSLIEERIRKREPDPERELSAARRLAPHMDMLGIGDHLVENGRRPLGEVASEVLRFAGWLPWEPPASATRRCDQRGPVRPDVIRECCKRIRRQRLVPRSN